MSRLASLPYRLRRKFAKEARSRAGDLDVQLDRFYYRTCVDRGGARKRLQSLHSLAPWGDEVDLSFVRPEVREQVIEQAENACAHVFDLLGSGPSDLGEEIDWHTDFKSGHRWDPGIHHARIKWAGLPSGVDIKVPWELSRCMHFAALGLADHLTGETRYYEEFKSQVRHWIAENPCGRGVNWACAMDVGLRSVNWINAAMLFRHRLDGEEDGFEGELCEALWMAGLHIWRNLEWAGPRLSMAGNHFLADLTGLVGVGAVFRNSRSGRKWLRFARKWFEHEMRVQVNPDGSHFETSTSYHRLVMEMFVWSSSVAARAGSPFSDAYRQRLGKMAGFVAAYTSPGGRAAQIGDNDSGRIMTVGIADPADHRYLLPGEVTKGGELDRWLISGREATGSANGDGSFPDGGYWFANEGDAWIGLRAGPVTHKGAHAHADQLSLVLSIGDADFVVDRGTGVYTPDTDIRNRYRSASSHNAPRVNGWEPNAFGSGRSEVFRMADDTLTKVEQWERDGGRTRFVGSHRGFDRYQNGLLVRRSVEFGKDSLIIEDELSGLEDDDLIEWCFQFGPGVEAGIEGNGVVLNEGSRSVRVSWENGLVGKVIDTDFSPGYGRLVPCKALMISTTQHRPGKSCFSLRFSWES
ncbi:MAG: alginate lyase family protein [Verrucomicrobiota bacterium]